MFLLQGAHSYDPDSSHFLRSRVWFFWPKRPKCVAKRTCTATEEEGQRSCFPQVHHQSELCTQSKHVLEEPGPNICITLPLTHRGVRAKVTLEQKIKIIFSAVFCVHAILERAHYPPRLHKCGIRASFLGLHEAEDKQGQN